MTASHPSTPATPRASRSRRPSQQAARAPQTGGDPPVYHDLDDATPEVLAKVRQLLVNGNTFEDTVAILAGSGKAIVTLPAVKNHYRSHLDIQEERINRQLGAADTLKKALKDPSCAQGRLAEAVLLTGLMGVNDKTEAAGVPNAMRVQSEQDSFRLKSDMARVQTRKLQADVQLLRIKLKYEQERVQRMEQRSEEVKQALQDGVGPGMKPEAIQRIQEIYGLLTDSSPQAKKHGAASDT